MCNYSYLLAIVLVLLISSCATLGRTEIATLNRTEFEPLMLQPDLESNELRIDLIRQSNDNKINDSTTVSEDTEYHPLGFDLGNGMFYDLNNNLCFRLDYLLGITDKDCWSLEKVSNRRKLRADCIYNFCNDTLSMIYPPRRREYYRNHRVYEEGTVSVMDRNRLMYAVDISDESAVYRHKRRKLDSILKVDENHYSRKKGFWKENFELQGNRLILNKDYIIELSVDRKKIQIFHSGWLTNRALYTIEKNTESLYIYDKLYRGRKIVLMENGLAVYHDKTFITGWKL